MWRSDMKVISEKRLVVGTISTLVGRYSLLDTEPVRYRLSTQLRESGALSFQVIDDEDFSNWIVVRGDFIVIPSQVPTMVEVKRVLTEEEAHLVTIPDEVPVE
jgi:hypothetical protein